MTNEERTKFIEEAIADKESRELFVNKLFEDKESKSSFVRKVSEDYDSQKSFTDKIANSKVAEAWIKESSEKKTDEYISKWYKIIVILVPVITFLAGGFATYQAKQAKDAAAEIKGYYKKNDDQAQRLLGQLDERMKKLDPLEKTLDDKFKKQWDRLDEFEQKSRLETLSLMHTSHSMIQQSILDLRNASTKLTETQLTLAGTMMIRDMQHDRRIRELDKKESDNAKSLLYAEAQLDLARIELGKAEEATAVNSRMIGDVRDLYNKSVGVVATDSFLLRANYPVSQVRLPAMASGSGGGFYEMEITARSIKNSYVELFIKVKQPTGIPPAPLYQVFVKEEKPIKGTPYSVYIDRVDSPLLAKNSALIKIIPTK